MKLLVAIDFSEITPRLLDLAAEQASGRDAHIWLLHAIPPEPDFVGYGAGPDVVRDQVAREWRTERQQLESFARQLQERGLQITPVCVQAPVVDAILDTAGEHDVDLIILGTHGRSVVYQVLVGSTSEGVLRQSKHPVLLVPCQPSH